MTETLSKKVLSRRDPAARKSLVLDAADALFNEEGFENVSISRVAARAGVAVGTLYLFFPDKASLLIGVINQRKSGITKVIRSNMPRKGETLVQSLERMIPPVFELILKTGPLGGPVDRTKLRSLGAEAVAAYDQVDETIREAFAILHENGVARIAQPKLTPKIASALVMSVAETVLIGEATKSEGESELLEAFARLLVVEP